MYKVIFGNENAEKDDNLYECEVQDLHFRTELKPILTGKWGSGKTASILLDYSKLSETLKKINPDFEKIWLIDENSLNIDALITLKGRFASDKISFTKSIEQIWTAEIVRRACILISTLSSFYKPSNAEHWSIIQRFSRTYSGIKKSVWEQIPNLLRFILPEDKAVPAENLQRGINELFNGELLKNIQYCLRDIIDFELQPVIAIEPIETPTSAIEEQAGLAQPMIISLLNTYRTFFQPSRDQLLQVRLSIPWHRYVTDDIDFPQKIRQYRGDVTWFDNSLREFINKRIEWEFRRVNRSFKFKGLSQDAWNTLFEDVITNNGCDIPVKEDSFNFVLRHTHYRPRDMQRIAREAVEQFSQHTKISIDHIISGKGGIKVSQKRIKQAIRITGYGNSDDLITEAGRRFGELRGIVDYMKGMKIPFTIDELEKKLRKAFDYDLIEILTILWDSGIIGLEITPDKIHDINAINEHLPASSYRYYKNYKNEEFHKYYLFEYSWKGDPYGTYIRYDTDKRTSAKFVIHPKTYY